MRSMAVASQEIILYHYRRTDRWRSRLTDGGKLDDKFDNEIAQHVRFMCCTWARFAKRPWTRSRDVRDISLISSVISAC